MRSLVLLSLAACGSTGVSVSASLVISDDPSEQHAMFQLKSEDCSGSHEDDDIECDPHEGLDAKAGAIVPEDIAIEVTRLTPTTARITWPNPVTSIHRRDILLETRQGGVRVGESQFIATLEWDRENFDIGVPETGAFVVVLRTTNTVLGGCYETPSVGIDGDLTLERRIAFSSL